MLEKRGNDGLRAVIFDCDGVMFDSREANRAYYNAILERFGKPPLSESDLEVVHMATAEESTDYLFRHDPRLSQAQEYRRELDYRRWLGLLRMEPHLEEVLATLKSRFRLAVATNRTTTMDMILTLFSLDKFFDFVVSALIVSKPKPHPECLLKILDHFSIDSSQAIYVGDSVIDYEVCRVTGVTFVAYKNPKLEAAYHIGDHRELLPLLSL
jgi:phosphoglycolate phosphatase